METLQLLAVCFLLLSTVFVAGQTKFANIKCNKSISAEIGKDIAITCINNAKFKNITVTFCTNGTLCSDSKDINTFENKFTTDNGRITLEININSAILNISNVQMSDQRIYCFFLDARNGYEKQNVTLKVVSTGQVERSFQRISSAGLVSSESERAVAETDTFEKLVTKDVISKEAKYSIIILMLIVVLAFVIPMALYWRKKKEIKYDGEFRMKIKDKISQ